MYNIFWKADHFGTAEVRICGLYYHVSCSCQLPDEGLYEVLLEGADRKVSLGICVPRGNCFGLDKRIPIKQVGDGPFRFALLKRDEETACFLPVEEGKPFSHIDKLKRARLAIKDGMIGIAYSDISKPTGQ